VFDLAVVGDRIEKFVAHIAPTKASESVALATPPRGDLPWRKIALQASGMWLVTRFLFFLITFFAVPFNSFQSAPERVFSPEMMFQSWRRWDATLYLHLAASGYQTSSQAAFFPLYPLLVRGVTFVVGQPNELLAGMLVSNLATLAAFFGVGLLAAHEDGNEATAPALRALAAYPLALFTVAAYADSLFLACAAFALFAARRGNWRWAALAAFLGGLTRPVSVILVLPLFWEYGRQQGWWSDGWRGLRRIRPALDGALVVLAVPLAIGLYALFLWRTFGDPLLFQHAQLVFFGREMLPIWQALGVDLSGWTHFQPWSLGQARILIDAAPVALLALATLLAIRKVPFTFTLFSLGLLYISLASPLVINAWDPLAAAGRYVLPAVPLYLILGRWMGKHRELDLLLVGGGFALQALTTALFLAGGFLI
jgi:hypothetical protein